MKAHVISLNDSVQAVVLDDLVKAQSKRDELREAYFAKNRGFFTKSEYQSQCHWHITSVKVDA